MDNGLLLDQRHPADLAPLSLDRAEALCVEAYFSLQSPLAESTQVLAAQWALRERMDAFGAFDAGATAGLNTKGYFGAAFDGRHVGGLYRRCYIVGSVHEGSGPQTRR